MVYKRDLVVFSILRIFRYVTFEQTLFTIYCISIESEMFKYVTIEERCSLPMTNSDYMN